MSLYRYLKPTSALPTASQAKLPESVLREINKEVESCLKRGIRRGKKRKYTATFTPEDGAAIGRYAAENGNAASVKKFKTSHDVGESTVRSFK